MAPSDGYSTRFRERAARSREAAARKIPGLRTIRRPATAQSPEFDLAYVRPAPGNGPIALVIPGGPGLAVPLMYQSFRARAVDAGLDIVMVEHRGVGLSRRDPDGHDLPPAALTVSQVVADLGAVLETEGIDRVILSGTSYGSYVAATFAVTHPERLDGLVLDSTTISAQEHDITRRYARSLLWHGESEETAASARRIRDLVTQHGLRAPVLGETAQVVYEFGGTALLDDYLDQLARDRARWTTAMVRRLLRQEIGAPSPHVMEYDLVRHLAYAELNTGVAPDGGIFDPAAVFHDADAPAFTGEHFDLHAQLPEVTVPALVLSGARDLRTPRPVAEAAAELLPDGVLVPLAGHAHSALDTRPTVLIDAIHAVAEGSHRTFAQRARRNLAAAPVVGTGKFLPLLVRAALTADRLRTVPCLPCRRHG
ncbi:alpha/beta fold hydrolase [Brachybacterium sp. GCM10030252]|uniref:alpha/beta fold hydrolase n=1 Tax=Brachybacterium sp. GCM10030252 TaxID=3273380 RepID=UPI00360B6BDE